MLKEVNGEGTIVKEKHFYGRVWVIEKINSRFLVITSFIF